MEEQQDNNLTKRQRRELKRQFQADDKAREIRNSRITTWAIVVVLVVAVGGLLYWAWTAGHKTDSSVPLVTPTLGGQDASVVINEYSDLSCPACASVAPTVRQLAKEYGDRIKIVFNSFDIGHRWSQKSMEAGLCANDQGKFWEFSDIAFSKQSEWETASNAIDLFKSYAQQVGVDIGRFNNCLDSGTMADAINNTTRSGAQKGVNSTPTFLINGQEVVGAQPLSQFKSIIDAALSKT